MSHSLVVYVSRTSLIFFGVVKVLEETGYDLEGQLDPENVLQMHIKEQSISLYIVPGVPEDFPFKTKTRKEISVSGSVDALKTTDLRSDQKIAWWRLSDLPTWRRNRITLPGAKFYLISPFIGYVWASPIIHIPC